MSLSCDEDEEIIDWDLELDMSLLLSHVIPADAAPEWTQRTEMTIHTRLFTTILDTMRENMIMAIRG
jgi:hypothetical protein